MKKLKIGIIGCGWFGNFHLDYLLTRDDVQIVALVNRGRDALVKTGEKVPHARLYDSFDEMISKELLLDALIVCVPPHEHHNVEVASAQKRVHLYIEKPLNNNLKEAQRIGKAIKESGIICSVGYQERYANGIDSAARLLDENPPYLFSGSWIDSTPSAKWWWDKSKSGGQIVEQATHIVDLMRYFLGEATEVFSVAGKPHPQAAKGISADSCSVSTITFASGAVGSLTTGCFNTQNMPNKVGLDIFSEGLQLKYTINSGIKVVADNKEKLYSHDSSNHQKSLGSFIDSVKDQTTTAILSDYEDALKTFKLTLALEQSLSDKRIIKLSEF